MPPAVSPLRPGVFMRPSTGFGVNAGLATDDGGYFTARSGAAMAGASTPLGGDCFTAVELPSPGPLAGPGALHADRMSMQSRCDQDKLRVHRASMAA